MYSPALSATKILAIMMSSCVKTVIANDAAITGMNLNTVLVIFTVLDCLFSIFVLGNRVSMSLKIVVTQNI